MRFSGLKIVLMHLAFWPLAFGENYQLISQPTCNEMVIGGFTHPGIIHSCDDLTRMQTKVWAGEEPWTTAFGRMFNESLVSLAVSIVNAYHIRGPLPELPYGEDSWSSNFTVDAQNAYLNAISYFVTGHPFHRERVLHTCRRWFTTLNLLEEYIRGGNGLRYITAAAEIFRSMPASGWTENDTQLYINFAQRIRRNWDSTNGAGRPDLFFNQGGYANSGALALAVFVNDVQLYKQMILQATAGANPDWRIDYAIGREIGNNGQVTEMGRDQGHPAGWLNILGSMAYTAEIQGDLEGQIKYVDLFSYADYRLLTGMEYYARYNLGLDVPWALREISDGNYSTLSGRDRGMIYRTQKHPTDIGALNAPTGAYYRFKERVPDRVNYLKKYVEVQTRGYDTLAFAREGNFEDLNYMWDNGYGASYMDVISGSASRRRSEFNETEEARHPNSTMPDIAVLQADTNVSYPLFFSTTTKPFFRFEARADGGADIIVTNDTGPVSEYQVPASNTFTTVFLNTTLAPSPENQMYWLWTSANVEIARFNMTEATNVVQPFVYNLVK